MSDILGFDQVDVESAIAYISHHSGAVELGHFLHALEAWQLFAEATGHRADPTQAKVAFESYFEHLRPSFLELSTILEITTV